MLLIMQAVEDEVVPEGKEIHAEVGVVVVGDEEDLILTNPLSIVPLNWLPGNLALLKKELVLLPEMMETEEDTIPVEQGFNHNSR